MGKLRIDDVLPPQRKSIRSLSIDKEDHMKPHLHTAHPTRHTHHKKEVPVEETVEFAPPSKTPKPPRSNGRRYAFWSIACATVGIFIFFLVTTLSGATISIVPMTSKVEANFSFKAVKDNGVGDIEYSTITLTQEATTQIAYTEKKTTNTKATGQVQLINSTTAAQKLVATTRLESVEGKIYRLVSAVTIPAKKGTQAGIITANIIADQAGPTYNATSTTFTIPGLKSNADKFKNITARSTSAGIVGGATGAQPVIKAADLKNARDLLQKSLIDQLGEQVKGQVPKDYILYADGVYFAFESENPKIIDTKNASITEKATVRAIIVRASDLASLVAKKTINSYRDEKVTIPEISTLELRFPNATAESVEKGSIQGTVNGSATIRWIVSEDEIKKSVSGIPQAQFESMMAKVNGLQKVHLLLTPFWKKRLPSDPEKIKIITTYDK